MKTPNLYFLSGVSSLFHLVLAVLLVYGLCDTGSDVITRSEGTRLR